MRTFLCISGYFAAIIIAEVVKWWAAGQLHSIWLVAKKMFYRV